jgi:hypothetical protein
LTSPPDPPHHATSKPAAQFPPTSRHDPMEARRVGLNDNAHREVEPVLMGGCPPLRPPGRCSSRTRGRAQTSDIVGRLGPSRYATCPLETGAAPSHTAVSRVQP